MPGDVLGFDAVNSGIHGCDFVAIEDCNVCAIAFSDLERLSRDIERLQRNLHELMGREITRNYEAMLLLGHMTIEARVASYLLTLLRRYADQGVGRSIFSLLLTRWEIGSYLGVRLETISRIFSRFQATGIIAIRGREVAIRNPQALNALIANSPNAQRGPAPRKVA
jgi:CRP/FNR family transcriptional regulator